MVSQTHFLDSLVYTMAFSSISHQDLKYAWYLGTSVKCFSTKYNMLVISTHIPKSPQKVWLPLGSTHIKKTVKILALPKLGGTPMKCGHLRSTFSTDEYWCSRYQYYELVQFTIYVFKSTVKYLVRYQFYFFALQQSAKYSTLKKWFLTLPKIFNW